MWQRPDNDAVGDPWLAGSIKNDSVSGTTRVRHLFPTTANQLLASRVVTRDNPMKLYGMLLGAAVAMLPIGAGLHAQAPPPNIIVIMGDDIGWSNIGVYN